MAPFQYRRISKQLVRDLNDKLLRGVSSVLLGPRYVGKRYLLQQLGDLREAERDKDNDPVVPLRFLTEPTLTRESDVQEVIDKAVESAGVKIPAKKTTGDLFFGLDKLYEQAGKPIILLAANVDAMAPHLSRYFLEGVRQRIHDGSLIAVLSGEHDLHDLVDSPKGEFSGADQYVIQDYDQEEFNDYLSNYSKSISVDFESRSEAYQ
jgi:hypothetical protein